MNEKDLWNYNSIFDIRWHALMKGGDTSPGLFEYVVAAVIGLTIAIIAFC